MRNKLILSSALFLLSACAVGPDYVQPKTETMQKWKNIPENNNLKVSTKAENTITKNGWWENFNDPVLNDLIKEAEKNNHDLKIAKERYTQAKADRLAALSNIFPEVSGTVDAKRGNRAFGSQQIIMNTLEAGFDSSWEIDFFGGDLRRYEAAKAGAEAAKADISAALIAVRSELALNYVEYRKLQNQLMLTQQSISALKKSAALKEQLFKSGMLDAAEIASTMNEVNNGEAKIPALNSALEASKNNITTLLGLIPTKLDEKLAKIAPVPLANKKFLVTTPAEAVAKRPDVKSAERNLATATALQGAALSNLFPKLSLGSFFGMQDGSLINQSKLWSLSAGLTVPIFSVGKVRSQIKTADSKQQELLNNYEKTVVAALAEIQNNLTSYINNEAQRGYLTEAATNAGVQFVMAKKRFDAGDASKIDKLTSKQKFYIAAIAKLESEADVSASLIRLNKSLGR